MTLTVFCDPPELANADAIYRSGRTGISVYVVGRRVVVWDLDLGCVAFERESDQPIDLAERVYNGLQHAPAVDHGFSRLAASRGNRPIGRNGR